MSRPCSCDLLLASVVREACLLSPGSTVRQQPSTVIDNSRQLDSFDSVVNSTASTALTVDSTVSTVVPSSVAVKTVKLSSSTARQSRQSRQSRQYTHFSILLSYLSKINSWYLEQDLVAGFSFVKKSSKKTKIRPNGGGVNVRNCCIHSSITPFVWLSVGPN